MVEKKFMIISEFGIHARPASILVSVANKFKSDVELNHNGKKVNLKSILGVMGLGVGLDEEIKIRTEGIDEQDALNELEKAIINEGLAK